MGPGARAREFGVGMALDFIVYGLALDLAHLLFNRKAIALDGLARYIRHVHLSGSTETLIRVPRAEGVYPLEPPLRQLARFYTRLVAFEGYAAGREMETVEDNLRTWRQWESAWDA